MLELLIKALVDSSQRIFLIYLEKSIQIETWFAKFIRKFLTWITNIYGV